MTKINETLTRTIKDLVELTGYSILRTDQLYALNEISRARDIIHIFNKDSHEIDPTILKKTLIHSKAQFRQDIFVLHELNFKNNGYFVEFGATNGVDFSNTHLLEFQFNWNGILAEPAKTWHLELLKNRNSIIDKDCVYSESNKSLDFFELEGMSGISKFAQNDMFSRYRTRNANKYSVNTISLNDLLERHNAPRLIDYVSIDTEGSEFEILNAFDFNKYEVKIFTIEHNYNKHQREQIKLLLNSKGYIRKYKECSKYDDWYVKN